MRKPSRRVLVTAVLVVAMASGATAAVAYWSAQGSGTAAAGTAGTASLSVNQRGTITGIDPDVAPQPISGTFDNPGPGSVYVSSVVVGITVTKAPGAPAGDCTAADYTLTGAAMTVDEEIPPGSSVGSWGGATIQFNNDPTEFQDACKGASVSFDYAVD